MPQGHAHTEGPRRAALRADRAAFPANALHPEQACSVPGAPDLHPPLCPKPPCRAGAFLLWPRRPSLLRLALRSGSFLGKHPGSPSARPGLVLT